MRSATDSATSLASSTSRDDQDGVIPSFIIPVDEANAAMRDFRKTVLARSASCVISGEGEPWFPGGPSPGIEAAHIVPQSHWNKYPLYGNHTLADANISAQLAAAWIATW